MDTIQFSSIKRCTICGELLLEMHPTGAYVHDQCAKDYDQHWDEREAELEYRARTGNDPRIRSHDVWQI